MTASVLPLRVLSLILLISCLVAFKVPEYYQKMTQATQGKVLDYYIVERNNERLTLSAGEVLPFVRGDSLKIVSAVLKDGSTVQGEVNVVGFRPPGDTGSRNDTGVLIDTTDNLDKKFWAVDNEGLTYAVVSALKKTVYGMAYLQRTEPMLKYVDIRLNDEIRVMREGQVIRLRSTDQFKVEKVVTNLKDVGEVKFRLVKVAKRKKKDLEKVIGKADAYELIFQHRSYDFATIPMLVEQL